MIAFRAADPPHQKPPSLNSGAQTHPPIRALITHPFPLRPSASCTSSINHSLGRLLVLKLAYYLALASSFFTSFSYSPVHFTFLLFLLPTTPFTWVFGRSCLAQIITFYQPPLLHFSIPCCAHLFFVAILSDSRALLGDTAVGKYFPVKHIRH